MRALSGVLEQRPRGCGDAKPQRGTTPPPYSVRRCVLGLGREIYLAVFGLYLDRTGPEWGTGERYVPVPSQCC